VLGSLSVCRAVLGVYKALGYRSFVFVRVSRALLRVYRALLCRALFSV